MQSVEVDKVNSGQSKDLNMLQAKYLKDHLTASQIAFAIAEF